MIARTRNEEKAKKSGAAKNVLKNQEPNVVKKTSNVKNVPTANGTQIPAPTRRVQPRRSTKTKAKRAMAQVKVLEKPKAMKPSRSTVTQNDPARQSETRFRDEILRIIEIGKRILAAQKRTEVNEAGPSTQGSSGTTTNMVKRNQTSSNKDLKDAEIPAKKARKA